MKTSAAAKQRSPATRRPRVNAAAKQRSPATRRPRAQIKRVIEERLRREFPRDTVDVSDGYKENLHVVVVSRKFDKMRDRIRQEMLWSLIDDTDLTKTEKGLISLVLPATPGEFK
jgi:hypothetical protein